MRLLFLCNNFHPLSIACLDSLHAAGRFEITVGLVKSPGGVKRMALTMYRRYGFIEALRRALRFVHVKARIAGRKCGLKLAGYQTVQEFALAHQFEPLTFASFNSREAVDVLRKRGIQLIVAGAFSQILGGELLAVPALGALNVHLSLLPKYRGPSACYWVVKNMEPVTGVTVHFMDESIDTGDIVLQREIPVRPGESPSQLERRLAPIGAALLLEAISQIEADTVRRVPQSQQAATYFSFPNSA